MGYSPRGRKELDTTERLHFTSNYGGHNENKLKWTGMGEFNSDDRYIYYCGQKFLRTNGVAIIVSKRVQNAVLGCNLNDLCSFPRQAIQYHSNPSLCPNQ